MGKRGFTLIELLAVILILGIISLIAIPVVSNIIEQAKMSSLKDTAQNVLAITEDYVTRKYMTDNPVLNERFIFPNDKKLEINNNPNNGYSRVINGEKYEIAINDGKYCAYKERNSEDITVVKLNGEKCESYITNKAVLKKYIDENSLSVYEDFRDDLYRKKILNVTFDYDLELPTDKVVSWDLSNDQDGSIIGYLVNNKNYEGYYDLYITSHEDIFLNVNSNGLFFNLINLQNITLTNFNSSEVEDFSNFLNSTGIKTINASKIDISNAKKLSGFFTNCQNLSNLDLSSWDTSNVEYFTNLFYMTKLKELDLSSWDTSKAISMSGMFWNSYYLESINLSRWDTSNVNNMLYMFAECKALKNLDITNFDTSNVTNMVWMFDNTYAIDYIKVGPKWTLAVEHDDYLKGSKISNLTLIQ